MSTYIESGHAKNTANFDHLIALLLTYGTNYTPSTANLAITNLQTVITNAQGALTNVKNEYNGWKNATNSIEIAFEPLKGLSTRLLNRFEFCNIINRFYFIKHVKRGRRC
jgi:hypothetical protein